MTVIASVSGVRIDCDACGHHTTAPTRPPETLRLETGFRLHGGRDWCPRCWSRHTLARNPSRGDGTSDDDPAAA